MSPANDSIPEDHLRDFLEFIRQIQRRFNARFLRKDRERAPPFLRKLIEGHRPGFFQKVSGVVFRLGGKGAATMSELASEFNLKPSTATNLVDHMVDAGLIHRYTPEDDRRTVRVDLTDRGRVFHEKISARAVELASTFLGPLDLAEQREFLRILRKIVDAL